MLQTIFGTHELANPFMNASGVHCMTTTELDELNRSCSGAYITKSCTPKSRVGNPKPRYIDLPNGSINSMGLPNQGFNYYLDYVETVPASKLRFFSIAGMSKEENIEMLHRLDESVFDGLTELNLSCPNVPGKPQLAYDFLETEKLLTEIFHFYKKPLGVKLPPYFDFVHFDEMASILNKFPIAYVNSINSVGNGLVINSELEQVVLKPKNGFGGLGGELIKPTALANVYAFSSRLRSDIQIIGTGGIQTGEDAFEHLLCGATLLQVGTQLHKEGVSVFQRLTKELTELMNKKGYTSIDQFRGKLQSIEFS